MKVVVGMHLKFYTSMRKGLKLKDKKVLRLISTFIEVTRKKLVGWPFSPPSRLNLLQMIMSDNRNLLDHSYTQVLPQGNSSLLYKMFFLLTHDPQLLMDLLNRRSAIYQFFLIFLHWHYNALDFYMAKPIHVVKSNSQRKLDMPMF